MSVSIATSSIVAQAWRFMELSPISSFDDDTEQARSAGEQYEPALRYCLAKADWSFASVIANLPAADLPDTVAADLDLPHFYQPPGDLIRLHEVGDRYTEYRLDLHGLRASDAAPLRIRYTALITDESKLPAGFQASVALRLAIMLGPKWLTTQSKMESLKRDFTAELATAKKEDGRSASGSRYDDNQAQHDDWATEATR